MTETSLRIVSPKAWGRRPIPSHASALAANCYKALFVDCLGFIF